MAKPRDPEKAVLFVGILAADRQSLALAAGALSERFGMPDRGSIIWRFENSEYYRDELGAEPLRAFLGWREPFSTDRIGGVKIVTNAMELELADRIGGELPRPVNIDPGYLTLAKLVLASAKNFSHRIHLYDSIYAEVTLQYRQGCFHTLPWTFPDFGSGRYDAFFLGLRRLIAH